MEVRIKKNHLIIFAAFCLVIIFVVLLGRSKLLTLASADNDDQPLTSNTKVLGTKVANKYDLVEPSPVDSNYIVPDTQAPHDEITISHTVQPGDSLAAIGAKYHADPQTIIDYPYNSIGNDLKLKVGQVIIIPNGSIDNPAPTPAIPTSTGQFAWPTTGNISQYASWWHPGAIDIAAPIGTPIRAVYNGRVIKVEKLTTGYGWHVITDHEDGLTSLYAHMSEIKVEQGQTISKDDVIGLVGSTGRSTGPHLHFEVKRGTTYVDPMTLLQGQ